MKSRLRLGLLGSSLLVISAAFVSAEVREQEQTEAELRLSAASPLSELLTKNLSVSGAKAPYRLQDVALDLEEGRIALAVLGRANSSTAESEQSLLPWSAIDFKKTEGLTVSLKEDQLDHSFRPGNEKSGQRPTRAQLSKFLQRLEQIPYWAERIAAATWGNNSEYERLFDAQKLHDFSGDVIKVETVTPLPGMAPGTQVTIKTDQGSVNVQLGPRWYLKQQNLAVREGDRLDGAGAEIQSGGNPAVMAVNIKIGDRKFSLRRPNGKAVWRNWSQRDEQYGLVLWSQLKGMSVRNDQGQALGKIADLAILMPSGIVGYVAMSGGDLPGDALRPVPLSAFVIDPKTEEWILELPADIVAGIKTFRSDEWPDKIDGGWLEYLHVRYGRPLFGGVQSQPHEVTDDNDDRS